MAIRVVARIRPRQAGELDQDVIVTTARTAAASSSSSSSKDDDKDENHASRIAAAAPLPSPTLVKIPSPKNENEDFTFQFSSVYDQSASQQVIFDREVAPTIKHLFNGFDVTIFAYGSTGTGKTHTMRGGKTLAERGVIPRLLSGIYRRGRKVEKDSGGQATVEIALSYYEIYNDKVFDLFEAPEKRTLAGLPLRDSNGKTVIVGLTQRPCDSLKDFEKLYDHANVNRSTGATKLNAHSSRSHAILCIKLMVTTGDAVRISTASAIDLAGSEDNRRTDNGKERLVESASINKSLFVLAKCVEAISSKSGERVPYRESKMTRILSLGQNNGLTVMILNLAPVRSFHLETLSSLNFANRTKKIEVREVENEPVFKGCPRPVPIAVASSMHRQPLRPLASSFHNVNIREPNTTSNPGKKSTKAFEVYSDKAKQSNPAVRSARVEAPRRSSPLKRPLESHTSSVSHPPKRRSPNRTPRQQAVMSKETIEDMIERKVTDILATRALDQPSIAPTADISEEVQKRLELLERKIEGQDDSREQGLTFLLMAKQHAVRGEDASALKMYSMAQEYFPHNTKLELKIERLHSKLEERKERERKRRRNEPCDEPPADPATRVTLHPPRASLGESYHDGPEPTSDTEPPTTDTFVSREQPKKTRQRQLPNTTSPIWDECASEEGHTPRTKRLLEIINTRDVGQIRLLRGVGTKKAEAILEALPAGVEPDEQAQRVSSLEQLGRLKGVGPKTVHSMRLGLEGGGVC